MKFLLIFFVAAAIQLNVCDCFAYSNSLRCISRPFAFDQSSQTGLPMPTKLRTILESVGYIYDNNMKFSTIVSYGEKFKLPSSLKKESNKVLGCHSDTYIVGSLQSRHEILAQSTAEFRCDSNALISKGLAGILCEGISGATCEEIIALDPQIINIANLESSMSQSRFLGFHGMIAKVKKIAEKIIKQVDKV